jgi:hypothetical protein
MMPSMRRAIACTLAAIACLQTACTTPAGPDYPVQPERRALGRIAVIGANFEPQYVVDARVEGKAMESARGALEGLGACSPGGGHNELALFFLLVCAPFGMTFGAIDGAVRGPAPQQIEGVRAGAQRDIAALKLQERMAEAVLRYGKEMGAEFARVPPDQARETADTAIEASVLTVTASITGGREMHIALGIQARVRVLSTHNGKEIHAFTRRCNVSGPRSPRTILFDDQSIKAAFEDCIASIAGDALDEMLFVYHPRRTRKTAQSDAEHAVPAYALRPIEPPLGYMATASALSSVRPELRWEPWPRGLDVVPGSDPGQAQDVRYDLRIFRAGRIVYERRGLTEPAHRLERQLRVCAAYRWTVRAQFRLDDAQRVTEWSGAYDALGGVEPWRFRRDGALPALAVGVSGPEPFYFLVETPCPCSRC